MTMTIDEAWEQATDVAWKLFCNWPSHRKPAREVN